ncbi:MAG: folylpolyglutamate synthase/dihydrofolate synthase family protein [Clostridiaceae bacterium]|nr:folylpolyglutamate synthase/dihydrofolate synthase family protein [Clostridiaceae bacterium]
MTYDETLSYIHSTLKFGSKPGLSRIRALMEACGNPQKKTRFVHITGTNGKGSTTMMLTNILRCAGYRVGSFISPYVDNFRERMQIDGEMIPPAALTAELENLLPKIEAIKEQGHTQPTEFEIVTALAFNWFADEHCDIVMLEVGMGGRLDCTNVIDAPEVAVLTPVSLDHTRILGSTVAEIARDKCGIIKPGCDAVTCYDQSPDALAVIRADCAEKGVALHIPDTAKLDLLRSDITGSLVDYGGMDLRINMAGVHQIQNALTAVTAAGVLHTRGWAVSDAHIREGIADTRFAGRLEIIRRNPIALLDGGHNPSGADAIARALDDYLSGRRVITVMGMCADKETAYCIPKIAQRSSIFLATQCDIPRALPAYDVARLAVGHCKEVHWNERVSTACRIALSLAEPDDVILVCGTLYILHEAREALSL